MSLRNVASANIPHVVEPIGMFVPIVRNLPLNMYITVFSEENYLPALPLSLLQRNRKKGNCCRWDFKRKNRRYVAMGLMCPRLFPHVALSVFHSKSLRMPSFFFSSGVSPARRVPTSPWLLRRRYQSSEAPAQSTSSCVRRPRRRGYAPLSAIRYLEIRLGWLRPLRTSAFGRFQMVSLS